MRYFEKSFLLTLEYELNHFNYEWKIYKSIEYPTHIKLSCLAAFFYS